MIAALIRWSVAQPLPGAAGHGVPDRGRGIWGVRTHAGRCAARPVGRAGHHPHQLPGQAPQIVENQVTYPLATTMLSVPGAKTVRGFSFFGDSFVYVLFEDGTDLYWARSRVLEYLNQVQGRLPASAKTALGPDATGVGWIYQYALVDRTRPQRPVAAARAAGLVPEVRAEERCPTWPRWPPSAAWSGSTRWCSTRSSWPPTASRTRRCARRCMDGNQETGGSVLELAEAEYMVRASGYLKTLDDFRAIPLAARGGMPVHAGRRGARAGRARDAARHRRARRRGRSRRRRRDPALGQERA